MIPGETILSMSPEDQQKVREDPHISEFKVIRYGGGYFIGTLYIYDHCDLCKETLMPYGTQEPNSRETGYFRTREEADAALLVYNKTGHLQRRRQ